MYSEQNYTVDSLCMYVCAGGGPLCTTVMATIITKCKVRVQLSIDSVYGLLQYRVEAPMVGQTP